MNKQESEIVRLLQLTNENKSPVIQALRRKIIDYVNSTEIYISELEMDLLQMQLKISDFEKFLHQQEKEINQKLKIAREGLLFDKK